MEQMARHIERLLEGTGPSVGYLGTRDTNHQASSTFVLSFAVKDNPVRVVAYIPEAALGDTRRNLLVSDYATLLIVNASTYEGVQLKGYTLLRSGDQEGEAFFKMNLQRLEAFYDSKLFKKVRIHPLMAVELTVAEIYNQTPGAGAGERL